MKLVRSWPQRIPEGRIGYVIDDMPRLLIDRYDLRPLGDIDDDVLLLEWDLAVGREDLLTFAGRACEYPERVMVAPYRLYPDGNPGLTEPIWAHRRFRDGIVPGQWVQIRLDVLPHIREGEPFCHLFGLGMIYLPRRLVRRFIDEYCTRNPQASFDDHNFAEWHFHHAEQPEVPVTWDIRPVHLHYSTQGLEL